MNKVYMIIEDDCVEGYNEIQTLLFADKNVAKKFFYNIKNETKVDASYNYEKENDTYFAFFDYGNYNDDHYVLQLLEKEIIQ